MIFSIGHDIIENARIEKLIAGYGTRVLNKLLTPLELELYKNRQDKVRFVAKRFAAKEAFAKACGTGIRSPILLLNISVVNDSLGKPYLLFASSVEEWLKNALIKHCYLTISDEKNLSSAIVVLEK